MGLDSNMKMLQAKQKGNHFLLITIRHSVKKRSAFDSSLSAIFQECDVACSNVLEGQGDRLKSLVCRVVALHVDSGSRDTA